MTDTLSSQEFEGFETLRGIRPPRAARVIALVTIGFVLLAAAFMILTPWVQTTSGAGFVTALEPGSRQQAINALVSGRIEEWYVRDGSQVQSGDPIVRIIDNDPQLLERLQTELDTLERKRDAAALAARTAELNYERQRALFEQGLSSRRVFEEAQIRLEELRGSQAQAEAELNRAQVDVSRQSIQVVRAPRDGTIVRVTAGEAATFVREGQTLAQFVPDDIARAVELLIDGRDIALVQPGRNVRLQFEGFPAIQYWGWPSIAVGTFAGEVAFVDPSARSDGRFRVLVVEPAADRCNRKDMSDTLRQKGECWPPVSFVRFGAKVRGWIILDEVRLGYEMWRQFNGFPPNFLPPDDAGSASPDA